ncbi:MAG TPA: hypothetical protein VHC70_09450 [Phycisphaerales bacterium]|nr:hypothetical protein [Phycisphaerales bacterium]
MPSSKPEVWFAIPSANPDKCRKTLPKWREQGYKIAILQNQVRAEIPADIVVWSDKYPGWAGSINILCRDIVPKSAPIVVSGGDDMLPDPNYTAEQLADQFLDRFPDTFGVMQPHGDDFMDAKEYCGSPFLGRKWIETMYRGTGPMCADYFHCYGDVELYWVARCFDALWCRDDLSHFHDHFTRTGGEQPDWHKLCEKRMATDCYTFIQRSFREFPGHEPKGMNRTIDMTPLRSTASTLADRHMAHFLARGPSGPEERTDAIGKMKSALLLCADRGWKSIAIYGGGRHTKDVASALMTTPVDVACIIDDNPARHGQRMWGFPIVSRENAAAKGIDAVVISSDAHEPALLQSCAPLQGRGISVVRLYGGERPEVVPAIKTTSAKTIRSAAA